MVRKSVVLPKCLGRAGPALRNAGLAAMLVSLAGCGSAPLATFDISAPSQGLASRTLRGVLVIPEPTASSPLDGDRIVVRSGASSVSVLKGAQWADRLPKLLQSRMIRTFENARLMRSVGRPGEGLTADHSFTWDVRHFEIDVSTGQAVVEISVKVLTPAGRFTAAKIFKATVPGSADGGPAATAALDAASHEVMRQIVAWTAARV